MAYLNEKCVDAILRIAELRPVESVPLLDNHSKNRSLALSSEDVEAARLLLVSQRRSKPNYKPPETRLRHRFSSTRLKEKQRNPANWTFSKHEVGQTINSLIFHSPLPRSTVAHAVWAHQSFDSLDELWRHFHDAELEKRTASRFRKSKPSSPPAMTWLNHVTRENHLDYISLMCEAGVGQEVIDAAFGIALSDRNFDAMEVLLGYGASASAYSDIIRTRMEVDDVVLARLLLSVPQAMSTEAWQACLEPQLGRYPAILHMALAQRPDIACASFFLKAIEMQNVRAAAILLAYAPRESDLIKASTQACSLVARLQDHEVRHEFLALFEQGHILTDCLALQQELLHCARLRELDMVALLLRCGVRPDVGSQNAFLWAVTTLDFEVLNMLMEVDLTISGSSLLASIKTTTPEHDMLRLLTLLAPRGLKGRLLDIHLVSAASRRQHLLAEKIIECGASTEHDDTCAIRAAVDNSDLTMLGLLLTAECSPPALSKVIPNVMALRPFASRLRILQAILSKGIGANELEQPLRAVMWEHDSTRLEIMELLLRHGAPIDSADDDDHNVILAASRHGDVEALELLCAAGPRLHTINQAVPLALSTIHAGQYEVTLATLRVLLNHGASGPLVHQTLLAALPEDEQLDVVHELVEHGADANYEDGSAFIVASRCPNKIALLNILCAFCPPNDASLASVITTCHHDRAYDIEALDIMLSSSEHASDVLNAHWSSEMLEDMPDRRRIIACFLKHGLDINMDHGSVLCAIVHAQDTTLLRNVLAADLRLETLKAAFTSAIGLGPRRIGLESMRLLLENANSVEIGQSDALLCETKTGISGDLAGLQLLLHHDASVDHDDGSALICAARAGALKVLDLLLPKRPSYGVLKQACLAAAGASLSEELKELVYGLLLASNDGSLARNKSSLLVDSLATLPEYVQLPQFLLDRGAKVRPASVLSAIQQCSENVFVLLLTHYRGANKADLFLFARSARMDLARRLWVYEALLCDNIPAESVSQALIETFELGDDHDLSCSKLLLQFGADVGYQDAQVLRLAFQTKSFDAIKLFSQHITSDITAAIVFETARRFEFDGLQMQLDVYQNLLQWNLGKASIDAALMESINSAQPEESMLRLLLAKGADPNQQNAICFLFAAVTNSQPLFEAMSKSADLKVVLQALLVNFESEKDVLRWAKLCIRGQSHAANINELGTLLPQCLRRFPNSTGLLKILLDVGVPISTMIDHSLGAGWAPEPCTMLLWSLVAEPPICNDAILLLLKYGGDAAQYSTPTTGVSAAFACLLDQSRRPVLQALLDLDRDAILSYEIPSSSLEHLVASPDGQCGPVSAQTVDMCMASLCLGNLDSYRMTNDGTAIDDGSLHVAALLALPTFVQWLLQTHDPNVKEEAQDFRIPLAVACSARPVPSCKFANAEADFNSRQLATMQLLARRTDLTIRHKGRTVLHLALDDGVQTTRSMLVALRVRNDPEWRKKHIFTDNGGQQHTPEEYVERVMEGTEAHKQALISCLKQAEIATPVRQPAVARARSTLTATGQSRRLSSGAKLKLQRRSSYPYAFPPQTARKGPRSQAGY